MLKGYGREIAKAGLDIRAIKLSPDKPFQWASGYQMPIYNDNRMFLFFPKHRSVIIDAFQQLIQGQALRYDVIAGTSTAGIPHGAALANRLDCPFVYVRDKPKSHGMKNQIEGIDAECNLNGEQVIVIEDLISTGGSSRRAVQAVRNAEGAVNYCLSIFSYGLSKAVEEFAELDPPCKVNSILTYAVLLEVAKERGYLTSSQVSVLEEWREDPFGWGEKHGFPKIESN